MLFSLLSALVTEADAGATVAHSTPIVAVLVMIVRDLLKERKAKNGHENGDTRLVALEARVKGLAETVQRGLESQTELHERLVGKTIPRIAEDFRKQNEVLIERCFSEVARLRRESREDMAEMLASMRRGERP